MNVDRELLKEMILGPEEYRGSQAAIETYYNTTQEEARFYRNFISNLDKIESFFETDRELIDSSVRYKIVIA